MYEYTVLPFSLCQVCVPAAGQPVRLRGESSVPNVYFPPRDLDVLLGIDVLAREWPQVLF